MHSSLFNINASDIWWDNIEDWYWMLNRNGCNSSAKANIHKGKKIGSRKSWNHLRDRHKNSQWCCCWTWKHFLQWGVYIFFIYLFWKWDVLVSSWLKGNKMDLISRRQEGWGESWRRRWKEQALWTSMLEKRAKVNALPGRLPTDQKERGWGARSNESEWEKRWKGGGLERGTCGGRMKAGTEAEGVKMVNWKKKP